MENRSLERVQPYYEQIYQTIKELIFQGHYQPGDRIYEAQIAKKFDVSRSPVREAVRTLVKEGLLVVNEKSQLEVYKPSLTDVEEIYQCRSALESLAVELATKNASDESIKGVEALLDTTKKALTEPNKDKNDWVSLNAEFHDQIVSLSRNRKLQKLLKDLSSLTHFYRVINFEGANRKETILAEHQKIFFYMKKREAETASALMAEHMKKDLEHLKDLLRKENHTGEEDGCEKV